MQSMPWPQDQGTLCDEGPTGDGTPSLGNSISVNIDVCISVAVRGHAASNARCEISSVNGKHLAMKHPELQSASIRIWKDEVRVSMNC